MPIYGYARVSTDEQTLDSQVTALKEAGAAKVYAEKISGAARNRPQLIKLLATLGPGDVVMVYALDRLARSTRDLLNILAEISEKGATFKSLREAWADTTTPLGEFVITILGGMAQFERSLILSRTQDGIRRARERGVKFGRRSKLDYHQTRRIWERLGQGESAYDIGRDYRISHTTVYRVRDRLTEEAVEIKSGVGSQGPVSVTRL